MKLKSVALVNFMPCPNAYSKLADYQFDWQNRQRKLSVKKLRASDSANHSDSYCDVIVV